MPTTIKILDYTDILAQGVPDNELHFNDRMKDFCGTKIQLSYYGRCENRELWDRGNGKWLVHNEWTWHPKWFKVVEGVLVNPITGEVYGQGYNPAPQSQAAPFVIEKNAWIDNEGLFKYYMAKTPVPETIAEVIVTLPANKVADTFIAKTWNFGHWTFTFRPAPAPTNEFTFLVRPHGVRSTTMTMVAKNTSIATLTNRDKLMAMFERLPISSVKTHTKDIYLAMYAVAMAMYNIQTTVLAQKLTYERNTIHLRDTGVEPRRRSNAPVPVSSQLNFIRSNGHTFYERDAQYVKAAGPNPTENHLHMSCQTYAATFHSVTTRSLSSAFYRLASQIKYFLYDTQIYVFDATDVDKVETGSLDISKPIHTQLPQNRLWLKSPYYGLTGIPVENLPNELPYKDLKVAGITIGYQLDGMSLQGVLATSLTQIPKFLLSQYTDTSWCEYGNGYYVVKKRARPSVDVYDYRQEFVNLYPTSNYAIGIVIDGITIHPRGKDALLQKQEMFKRYGISLSTRQINEIEEYDYEVEPEFFYDKFNGEDFYLGAELEVDNGGDDDHSILILENILGKDYAYYMRDGSLNNGFEIAMMPSTLAYVNKHKQKFTDAFKYLSSLDYRSHDTSTCGLHIHFDRDAFGTKPSVQKLKAAYLALILERNWGQITKFARRTRSQMNSWAVNKKLVADVYHDDNESTFTKKFEEKYMDRSKYNALNCNHRYTFELRIFKGTLNANTYLATMQFTHNLINVAKQCKTLDEAQQVKFADIISYKSYPELTKYLGQRALNNTEEEV